MEVNKEDLVSWFHNSITKRLLSQISDEISSINMTLISGECDQPRYSYLCGRIAGLRVLEDFHVNMRDGGSEDVG